MCRIWTQQSSSFNALGIITDVCWWQLIDFILKKLTLMHVPLIFCKDQVFIQTMKTASSHQTYVYIAGRFTCSKFALCTHNSLNENIHSTVSKSWQMSDMDFAKGNSTRLQLRWHVHKIIIDLISFESWFSPLRLHFGTCTLRTVALWAIFEVKYCFFTLQGVLWCGTLQPFVPTSMKIGHQ